MIEVREKSQVVAFFDGRLLICKAIQTGGAHRGIHLPRQAAPQHQQHRMAQRSQAGSCQVRGTVR